MLPIINYIATKCIIDKVIFILYTNSVQTREANVCNQNCLNNAIQTWHNAAGWCPGCAAKDKATAEAQRNDEKATAENQTGCREFFEVCRTFISRRFNFKLFELISLSLEYKIFFTECYTIRSWKYLWWKATNVKNDYWRYTRMQWRNMQVWLATAQMHIKQRILCCIFVLY